MGFIESSCKVQRETNTENSEVEKASTIISDILFIGGFDYV